jgi:CIC family chloride channel protein
MAEERKSERSLAPAGRARLPLPVLRRLGRIVDKGLEGQGPLSLQLLGRTLLHAAAVGACAGIASIAFVGALELAQYGMLERLTGYSPLRAAGEHGLGEGAEGTFRPWLLFIIPAIGALLSGLVSRLAPETYGGGADAIIDAFHNRGGEVRRRVPFVKALASVLTLGSGGAGGREGPTMQIGGSIGSIVARYLRLTDRERRILLVAGTAAGMAAVFRTPLGAALLAVEVLHRDDFESDALVPSVLASVVSYSIFISFFGETTLFAHAPAYPFVPRHLPLYALMAVGVSLAAALFVHALNGVRRLALRINLPTWSKPALGGLCLGVLATAIVLYVGARIGQHGHGLGILEGGYGAAQVSIMGAPWFPQGWRGVELLVLLGLLKIGATSLTVGSGGSAGDFGPSMAMGGIFGGAFGRAAQLLLNDPRIDPGAFALVGMATFYGGLAHAPIGSLVMTCELAGSYDLLVPLMLAEGIAFVALRNQSLYHSQVPTKRDSPAHRDELVLDLLKGMRVDDVLTRDRELVTFRRNEKAAEVIRRVGTVEWQDSFPVLDEERRLVGVITADILRTTAVEPDAIPITIADDMMGAATSLREGDDLHRALEVLLATGMREVIVTDSEGRVVGVVDQSEISAAYLAATARRPG